MHHNVFIPLRVHGHTHTLLSVLSLGNHASPKPLFTQSVKMNGGAKVCERKIERERDFEKTEFGHKCFLKQHTQLASESIVHCRLCVTTIDGR